MSNLCPEHGNTGGLPIAQAQDSQELVKMRVRCISGITLYTAPYSRILQKACEESKLHAILL